MNLEAKTKDYWRVSSVWNGQSKEKISVAKANRLLRGILTTTNPQRPLSALTAILSGEIIVGNCGHRLNKTESHT